MHLITMAHHGEAQGVIEKFKLKKIAPDLFRNESLTLLLTGEGPFEAAVKTAMILGSFKYSEVINLGLAGSLSQDLKKGEIVPVRSIYLIQELKPQFKSYSSQEKGLDCLTSFERILDGNKARLLKGIGTLIDREAWGVAMAAKTAGVAFRSYKIISDYADSTKICEVVKEDAEEMSIKIAEFLPEILDTAAPSKTETDLPGFHFTFSMRHRFENLLQKLSIKEETESSVILSKLPLQDFQGTPKEKTKKLIEYLEDRIDPFRKVLLQTTQFVQKDFQDKGFTAHIDPFFENPKISVSFEAGDTHELHSKAELLKKIDLTPFTSLMKGEIHVE